MAYMMAAGVTILCIGAIIMTRGSLAGIFGVSSQVQEMYETVILYFAAGLVFAAFLRVTTSYFYAVEQNLSAYILIYGEPSLLAVLIALVLPGFWGFPACGSQSRLPRQALRWPEVSSWREAPEKAPGTGEARHSKGAGRKDQRERAADTK